MSIICYDSERNLLERLYQWDVNQTISVTGINTLQSPVFHFCNQRSEVALVVVPDMVDGMLTAEIPNSLLKEPETLFVYIYYNTGDDGRRTFYRVRVPVIPRQRPQNYSDTENVNFTSAEILDAQLVTLIASMAETASANMLAEVEDIRHGYDGTTYQSAGDAVRAIGEALSQADHTHNVFSFETDTEYNSYYSNNTGSIRVGDFIIIGGNSVFLKMRNSLELLFTTNDLYRKPSEGIPFEDLDPSLQLRIAEGGGNTTGPTYIIQGGDSKVWGFTSETAFTQYKALNPNDIHNGDYVWIKETTPFTKSYHLYAIDSQATGGRTSIFDIDDTLLVTVQPGGVSGSYVTDHYLPDILEAYYNGSSIALLTDYGVVLSPSKYNVDNGNNPVSVDFSGLFEYDGVYYGITYTISQYSVVASRRALNKAVIEVESTSTEGVYTIYRVNGQTSWSNLNLYIENMMFDEGAAVVLHVDGLEYPCIRANQLDAYFGAFDPFNQVYVLFSILRSNSTCTRNEIPFSSSQGSGSGATITDGSILKRHLAANVQASLNKADAAVPNSFGSANSGKPIVVNASGEASVGSWPSDSQSGGTTTWSEILPSGGIPGTDLSDDVIAVISRGQKAIVTYNALTQTVNATPAQIYDVWHQITQNGYTGNAVVLNEADMGDYEIPLVYVDSTYSHAVFSAPIRDYSSGNTKIATYYISSDGSAVKTVSPILPIPTAQQIGFIPVVNGQGGFTLTMPEAAAGSDGLSPQLKNALLQFAAAAVANTQDGATAQAIYQNLYDALYPQTEPAELVSISAVYTQGGATVYDNASLNDLKPSLVVTAHYDDNTSEVVQGYTLTGTLTAGTSTVNVTYEGLTTTFSVTVTAFPFVFTQWIENVDGADSWIDTGVVPDDDFGFKVSVSRENPASDVTLYGMREDSGDTRCNAGTTPSGTPFVGWGVVASNSTLVPTLQANTPFEISCNYKGDRALKCDGAAIRTDPLNTLPSVTRSFVLLGRNNAANGPGGVRQRFHGAEFTSGSAVTHRYRPGYRRSDSEIGVYDEITGTILVNAGTGAFTKGADL